MNVELKICRCESPYLNQISYTIARARLHNTHMYCNNRPKIIDVCTVLSVNDGLSGNPPKTSGNPPQWVSGFLNNKKFEKKYIY